MGNFLKSKALANLVAVGALVVAFLAFQHASSAQDKASDSQKKANAIAAQIKDIQGQALTVQKDALERTGAAITIEAIAIQLDFADNKFTIFGGPDYGWRQDAISPGEWSSALQRWGLVRVSNVGQRDGRIIKAGMGITDSLYDVNVASAMYCDNQDRSITSSSDLCVKPLVPGETRSYYFLLNKASMAGLEEDSRKKGFRVCVDYTPYGKNCQQGTKARVPANWQSVFSPNGS